MVFPEWPTDLAFDDYAQDLFRAAKIGQQGKDNGVLVLVSIKEHKIRIHTGRGLEGALPDALCIRIIHEDFAPQFQTGNYDQGFRRGLAAVLAAARGEYRGDGTTAAQRGAGPHEISVNYFDFPPALPCRHCVFSFPIRSYATYPWIRTRRKRKA